MTDRPDEEPRPGDADGHCPGPSGGRTAGRPATDADRPTVADRPATPDRPAPADAAGSPGRSATGPPTDPAAPAWPPLVHVPDCDRSELLRRIVGG